MIRELKERVFKRVLMVLLPGESHGQRNLVGYRPWGCTESEMTEMTEHTGLDGLGGCYAM